MADPGFAPIAIIGQGCVLPGCFTPNALWQAVADGRDLLRPARAQDWGITEREADALGGRGGFVRGFDSIFQPDTFDLDGIDPRRLDPVFQWLLHAGEKAWRDSGQPEVSAERIAVTAANLSYPTRSLCDYAADIWIDGRSEIDPLNRFNSGFPSILLAHALGAEGPRFCLDAACASSLYALKLACDELQWDRADIAVAGAVNAADNLILHQGFEALQARSPTGRSRPLIEGADGLVPAEGAAVIILKRLSDVAPGERVHGIIRAIGLSNDGRRRGLLAPSADGQTEAMRRAYQMSGLDPMRDIQLLEAHATGTPVGDGVELSSAHQVLAAGRSTALPVGSLKGNTGHLITVAGLGGLIKLTQAMQHRKLPPTRLDGAPLELFSEVNLTPQATLEDWVSNGPRRAALSTFGFGGNNAHLILEEPPRGPVPAVAKPLVRSPEPIAAVSLAAMAGPDADLTSIIRRLMRALSESAGPTPPISVNPVSARVPPNDLTHAQASQLAVLNLVEQALDGVDPPEPDRVGVYVGMACAPDPARWMLRARLAARPGVSPEALETEQLRTDIAPPLEAQDVLGAMPNMPANRLTHAQDWRGQGFTLAAEHGSGDAALRCAITTLQAGEIDLAIVAAADFSSDDISRAAISAIAADRTGGDAAALMLLKRASDAQNSSDAIWGHVDLPDVPPESPLSPDVEDALIAQYGNAPASHGLLKHVVSLALETRGLALTRQGVAPDIRPERNAPCRPAGDMIRHHPHLAWYSAEDRQALAERIAADRRGGTGPCRLALVATSADGLEALQMEAQDALRRDEAPEGEGIHFGEGEAEGELAFVFTGSATTYPQMGRGLFSAFPELCEDMADRFPEAELLSPLLARRELTPFQELCCAVLISQAQAMLARDWLGMKPTASLGLSLGETNQLIAFGCWRDPARLLDEIAAGEMYERHLGGQFDVARQAWGIDGPIDFQTWQVSAPVEMVQALVDRHTNLDVTIIYSHEDCLIGGPAEACRAIAAEISAGRAHRVRHDLFVHTRALAPYLDDWRRYHTRKTRRADGVRLYSNAWNAAYSPTKARAAEALTLQAANPIDFPKTVEQAWKDGVHTFVEIGPRGLLSRSISKILGDRPHRATSMDRIAASNLEQVARASADVFAAGHKVAMEKLAARLDEIAANPWPRHTPASTAIAVPAHPPAPKLKRHEAIPCMSNIPFPDAPKLPPLVYPAHDASKTSPSKPVTPPTARPRSSRSSSAPAPLAVRNPEGPAFDSEAIAAATTGPISGLFGTAFQKQDGYARQVRLPAPPLLLVDRITGIAAQAGTAGKGTIWTQTDIEADAWYLHRGHMRPGPLIEAGQADLSLISWMGADFLNQNERVYRLLGCELTVQDSVLPRPGETLDFQIEITGHAELRGVRMFFFEYDCRVGGRLLHSVRNGQAGFFTDEELASSKGVFWSAETNDPPTTSPRPFDRSRATQKTAFSAQDLEHLRNGDSLACFGPGFEWAGPHSATPDLPGDKLALIDDVPVFTPTGGPWGRGYLKARQYVPKDAWFYDGHFHNDPCMPGTLMAEAAVQALELAALAMGLGIDRDGFVFEPIPGHTSKFLCRGQVIPDRDHDITYEVFIDEIVEGETPEIYGALLATSDGLKVFYCPRFGVRLRRNWPAASGPKVLIGPERESHGDEAAMMACAYGAPSDAFGEMYARFDTESRVPRLPQPPYHMISRMRSVSTRPNVPDIGAEAVAEFDIDPDAWYFADSASGTMPYAVLVEVLLQPCGWLASHCGFALEGGLYFRNLDGNGEVHGEVTLDAGRLVTRTQLKQVSKIGSMTIVGFSVHCESADGATIMTLDTSFGFFPAEALAKQAGLKGKTVLSDLEAQPVEPQKLPRAGARLSSGQLSMLDQVDHFDPDGGAEGLGSARARQSVDPRAWYFKAHFFQDPVQPGSLGIEALLQLLMQTTKLKGLDQRFRNPRFVSPAPDQALKWRCRGQVTPDKSEVTTLIDITAIETLPDRIRITANGALWCDGLPIYDASGLSVDMVDDT